MPRLLVVHHSPSRSMQALTEAVLAGANDPQIEGVEVVARPALEATAADVLAAQGYVLGSTANFGYMSGAMKHFFDTTFLQVGGSLDEHGGASESEGVTAKRPFGLYVHGRYDTTGAVRSILSITGALGWRQSAAVREVLGDVDSAGVQTAYELGATVSALLMQE
ncbi:MAG: flavodoxin [Frankiales bacterium]|nr:flavodoxin [Frankiales bacterium]